MGDIGSGSSMIESGKAPQVAQNKSLRDGKELDQEQQS